MHATMPPFGMKKNLRLTSVYDICSHGHAGNEVRQAMLISSNNNLNQLKTCLETAHNFLRSQDDVRAIFEKQQAIAEEHWATHSVFVCISIETTTILTQVADRTLFFQYKQLFCLLTFNYIICTL